MEEYSTLRPESRGYLSREQFRKFAEIHWRAV